MAAGSGRVVAVAGQRAVVLDHALQRLPGQVEAVELGVALLQLGDDAQALGVVVEAAVRRHHRLQRVLAGMAERRVAEIVGERQRLGQILVEPQRAADRAGDLRDLQAVGQARAEVVALVIDEDLGLVFEPAERGGMDDAVAVALEAGAGAAFRLGVEAAATGRRAARPWGERVRRWHAQNVQNGDPVRQRLFPAAGL